MRILVVDDDKEIREFLKTSLESELFSVDVAEDGKKGSYVARTNDYDLIILDNVLPGKNGLEVCKEIRECGRQTPILMLSVKSEIDEKALVLDCGADDYLTKPYSHKELISRMRALLRRSPIIQSEVLQYDQLQLSTKTQEVSLKGKNIYLTKKEFILLELLLKNKGTIVSRAAISEHVWDMQANPFSRTIETHIGNLRKKIEEYNQKIIYTIPGRGYTIKDH